MSEVIGFEKLVFSVTDFLSLLNNFFAAQFTEVCIEGEVSEAKPHPSGFYFSLKDEESVMSCYMSPWQFKSLGFTVEEGMRLRCYGSPSIYKPKGRFSFVAKRLELSGEGAFKRAYELLKQKIETEGLMARKRILPECIRKIGVITSKTGAVIHDFRQNLDDLGFKVFVFDVRVEGVRAPQDILRGINFFNRKISDLDVLVIIRGGGSLEDLQAFNNELVVRAIFASAIPTICGIGHDKDVPISSLVSDSACSTPTAVAHLMNASWEGIIKDTQLASGNFLYHTRTYLLRLEHEFSDAATRLIYYKDGLLQRGKDLIQHALGVVSDLRERFFELIKTVEGMETAINNSFRERLREFVFNLDIYEAVITNSNPEKVFARGYSIIKNVDGVIIKDAKNVKRGDMLLTRLMKGSLETEVKKIFYEEKREN